MEKQNEQKQNIESEQEQDIEKNKKRNIEDIIIEKDTKINELTDKYLRALAEIDNFRKRVAKEKKEFEKNTKGEAIYIFLPILDNLERAISAIDTTKDIESIKKGIEMIIKQFKDILKDLGVKEIETKGIFNPDFHQVLQKEYVEGKNEGEILEVYQNGYCFEDKVIRPALVKVVYIPKEKIEEESQNEKEINNETKR